MFRCEALDGPGLGVGVLSSCTSVYSVIHDLGRSQIRASPLLVRPHPEPINPSFEPGGVGFSDPILRRDSSLKSNVSALSSNSTSCTGVPRS